MTHGDVNVSGSVEVRFFDPELFKAVTETGRDLARQYQRVVEEYAYMRRLYRLERSIARRYDRCCHAGRRIRLPHNYALGALCIALNSTYGRLGRIK